MAAVVASHLVKVEPEEAGWWINLAYATRRCESIEKAETILLRARELHHNNALIEFNLACYASVTAISEASGCPGGRRSAPAALDEKAVKSFLKFISYFCGAVGSSARAAQGVCR
jgi:hypothetical protein